MGKAPCCAKVGLRRGAWTPREDELLIKYIQCHGEGQWKSVSQKAGLLRCRKSCRLRWMNYLRPDIKRGNISPEEEDLIIRLHALLGNRWSLIAGRLPGRTDNEIKNYWNSHLSKKLKGQEFTKQKGRVSQRKTNQTKKKDKKKEANKKNNDLVKSMEDPKGTKIYVPKPNRFTCSHEGSRNSVNINEAALKLQGSKSNNTSMQYVNTLGIFQDDALLDDDLGTNDLSTLDDLHEKIFQEYLKALLNSVR